MNKHELAPPLPVFPTGWCKLKGVVYTYYYSTGRGLPENLTGFASYCVSFPVPIYWHIALHVYIPCANILALCVLSVKQYVALLHMKHTVHRTCPVTTYVAVLDRSQMFLHHIFWAHYRVQHSVALRKAGLERASQMYDYLMGPWSVYKPHPGKSSALHWCTQKKPRHNDIRSLSGTTACTCMNNQRTTSPL